MKELQQHISVDAKPQIVKEVKTPKEPEYLSSFQLHKGQKLWKYSAKEDILLPMSDADFDVQYTYNPNSEKMNLVKNLLIQKNCVYVTAINRKNALKKVKILLGKTLII